MSELDAIMELAKSAGKLQAELNEMGVGTRESQLEAENKRLRESEDMIYLPNGAEVRVKCTEDNCLMLRVSKGYAMMALPHEPHYITIQIAEE